MEEEKKMQCGHVQAQHRFIVKHPAIAKDTEKYRKKCDESGVDPKELFKFHYFARKKDGSMLQGKENIFLIYGHCAPAMQIFVRDFTRGTIIGMAIDESEELVKTDTYDFPRSSREGAIDHFIMRMSPKAFPPPSSSEEGEGDAKSTCTYPLEILFNLDLHLEDAESRAKFSALRHTGDPRYRRGNILVLLNQGPFLTGMHEKFDDWSNELCHVIRIMEHYLFKDSYCAVPGCSSPMKFIDVYVVQNPHDIKEVEGEKADEMPKKPVMVATYPVCGMGCRKVLYSLFWDCFRRGIAHSLDDEKKEDLISSPSKYTRSCTVCNDNIATVRCPTPCQKPYCGKACQRKDWKKHKQTCPNAVKRTK